MIRLSRKQLNILLIAYIVVLVWITIFKGGFLVSLEVIKTNLATPLLERFLYDLIPFQSTLRLIIKGEYIHVLYILLMLSFLFLLE